MLSNRYLLPELLAEDTDDLHVGKDDELQTMYLDDVPQEFFGLWTDAEMKWASGLYHDEEFSAVRARSIEIQRELVHEPRGERRTRLVEELSGLPSGGRELRRV